MIVRLVKICFCLIGLIKAVKSVEEQAVDQLLAQDLCAKKCLNAVAAHEGEFSFLKHQHLENYLSKHDKTCQILTTAKKCVKACGVQSNPFELGVFAAHCSKTANENVKVLKTCLEKTKGKIHEFCTKKCGDYKKMKQEIHELNEQMIHDANLTETVAIKTNEACSSFKCLTRCNLNETTTECSKEAGKAFQNLFQNILDAQNKDAVDLNIIEKIRHTTPPHCGYHHNPKVMFDLEEDEKTMKNHPVDHTLQVSSASEAVGQTQIRVLVEQLAVLKQQEEVLKKENAKLDLELQILRENERKSETKVVQN